MPRKLPAARPTSDVDLETLAVEAGQSWAASYTTELRNQHRPVVGAWPGTMTEARAWVLATMATHGTRDRLSLDRLRALSRTAYGVARTRWQSVCERDVEP